MKISNILAGKEWKELKKIENLPTDEKSIVFYAENKASMNHFKLLILELTEKMNFQICYVTSVKEDKMLENKNEKIKSFYIGDGVARTKFFLTLNAKILIMDMPDLQKFHIKRSKTFPVHYIYIFHSIFSVHSYLREGAIDNYDTIFCVGQHHINEIIETEKVYGLKQKKLVNYGYGRLDTLLSEKQQFQKKESTLKTILIVPSYGKDNLLITCGIKLITILLESKYKIILRPHFKTLKESTKLLNEIEKKFKNNSNFILEKGVIPTDSFHNSICMISDWSGISFEYAFTFEREVIFIDVPKKEINQKSDKISLEPIEIPLRYKIGRVVPTSNLEHILEILKNIEHTEKDITERIQNIRSKTIFNIGNSACVGAKYIQQLIDKINK